MLAVASFALIRGSERAFLAEHAALAAFLEVARLVLFLFWFFAVWKYSRNTGRRGWTYAARAAALTALAASAILY